MKFHLQLTTDHEQLNDYQYGLPFRQTHDQSPRSGAALKRLRRTRGNPQIDAVHLLAVLAKETDGIFWPHY
ncbi:MAG: hypothetical protein QM775_17065 [Pirellulales bacterium]